MNVKNKNKTLRVLLIIYLAAIIVRISTTSFPFYSISIFINCVAVLYWAFMYGVGLRPSWCITCRCGQKMYGEGILDIMEKTMKGERVYPAATPTVILGNIASSELTPTELDVLRELTRGASNVEIGEKLFISPTTVRTHISNMLAKTGFANRTELAIRARLEGLVIPED